MNMTASPQALRDFEAVVALGGLATVAVCLRLLARKFCKASYSGDDIWIIISLVAMYGFIVDSGFFVFAGGVGKHISELTASEVRVFSKAGLASEILYFLTITTAKLSVLVLYCRLFPTRSVLWPAKAIGVICIAWCITCILVTIFQCQPIDGAWNLVVRRHCVNYFESFLLGTAISNVLTDVLILCLPFRVVWSLALPFRQKLVLTGIFLLGSFVCVASIMRIITIRKIDMSDIPYTALRGATWSIIEAELGITCACLPTLRPIFCKTERIKRTVNRLSAYSQSLSISRHTTKPDSWNDRVIGLAASDDHDCESGLSISHGSSKSQRGYALNEERAFIVDDGAGRIL